MHESLRHNFPKACKPCATFFSNEKDYTLCTKTKKGFIDGSEFKLGYLFSRDCKHCPSTGAWGTMTISLNPETFKLEDKFRFESYIIQRADKEKKDVKEILDNFRDEYNDLYLPSNHL